MIYINTFFVFKEQNQSDDQYDDYISQKLVEMS